MSPPVARSVEDALVERILQYVFEQHGMEVQCDGSEIVSAIFLYAEEYGGFNDALFEIPLSLTRQHVQDHFGAPTKCGGPTNDPILGEYGPWDRYGRPGFVVHVEFKHVTRDTGAVRRSLDLDLGVIV